MARRIAALVAAALLLGCSTATPNPPSPPPEIIVLGLPGGAHEVIQSRDGRDLADLPAGILAVRLNGGGDIGEAYLVAPAGDAATVAALQPAHSYSVSEVARQDGAPLAAVLAPAPGLTSFVGPQTVLVLLDGRGALTGYQHGSRLWSTPVPSSPPGLRLAGSQVLVGSAGAWRPVHLTDGSLGDPLGGPPCLPGPLAESGGGLVEDCGGRLLPAGVAVPAGEPAVLAAGASQLLYFPGGELWRLEGPSARRVGVAPAWTAFPAISPDGGSVYLATPDGIDEVSARTAAARQLVRRSGITSVATSRDGNYVYALAGGHLYTFSRGGRQLAEVPAAGQTIEVVAGG